MLFASTILITGTREKGRKVYADAIPACIVDDGQADAASEGFVSANTDRYTFFIRKGDWPDFIAPQIGDKITSDDGCVYIATRVAHLGDCYSINAKTRK